MLKYVYKYKKTYFIKRKTYLHIKSLCLATLRYNWEFFLDIFCCFHLFLTGKLQFEPHGMLESKEQLEQ